MTSKKLISYLLVFLFFGFLLLPLIDSLFSIAPRTQYENRKLATIPSTSITDLFDLPENMIPTFQITLDLDPYWSN